MIVAVTGHRPSKIDGDYTLSSPPWKAIRAWFDLQLATHQPEKLISGMALGVDQVAAQAALDAGVTLVAAVPFVGQADRWPDSSRVRYRELIGQAHEFVCLWSGGYAPWKMHARNEWMVDNSDELWAVTDGTPGGTQACIDYALRMPSSADLFTPPSFASPYLVRTYFPAGHES